MPSYNFQAIFGTALNAYKKRTKQDLATHPLASQLQGCDSSKAVLTLLQDQIDQFDRSRGSNERLKKWLNPTVNVLYAFSEVFSEGIGLVNISFHRSVGNSDLMPTRQVFSPARMVFAGIGVLLLVSDLDLPLVRASASVIPCILRQLLKSTQAKMLLSTSSSTLKISSDGSKFLSRSHKHQ